MQRLLARGLGMRFCREVDWGIDTQIAEFEFRLGSFHNQHDFQCIVMLVGVFNCPVLRAAPTAPATATTTTALVGTLGTGCIGVIVRLMGNRGRGGNERSVGGCVHCAKGGNRLATDVIAGWHRC